VAIPATLATLAVTSATTVNLAVRTLLRGLVITVHNGTACPDQDVATGVNLTNLGNVKGPANRAAVAHRVVAVHSVSLFPYPNYNKFEVVFEPISEEISGKGNDDIVAQLAPGGMNDAPHTLNLYTM